MWCSARDLSMLWIKESGGCIPDPSHSLLCRSSLTQGSLGPHSLELPALAAALCLLHPQSLFNLPSTVMPVSPHCENVSLPQNICLDEPLRPTSQCSRKQWTGCFLPWSPPDVQRAPLPCFLSPISILCPSQVIDMCVWGVESVAVRKWRQPVQSSMGKNTGVDCVLSRWVSWDYSRSCEVNFQ